MFALHNVESALRDPVLAAFCVKSEEATVTEMIGGVVPVIGVGFEADGKILMFSRGDSSASARAPHGSLFFIALTSASKAELERFRENFKVLGAKDVPDVVVVKEKAEALGALARCLKKDVVGFAALAETSMREVAMLRKQTEALQNGFGDLEALFHRRGLQLTGRVFVLCQTTMKAIIP
jgi:Family of unknown function (DUF6212)